MNCPERNRNAVLRGDHHGKAIVIRLIKQTNMNVGIRTDKWLKYLGILFREIKSGLIIGPIHATKVFSKLKETTYLFKRFGTLGYVNSDKEATTIWVTNGSCLVISTVKDKLLGTKLLVKRAMQKWILGIRRIDRPDYSFSNQNLPFNAYSEMKHVK
ncbi:hypothetical protein D915_000276 [Fasciola hepatica]|uniref:Uncharacterized protein n=1 Tax=Fasciola hepatica TaxID=6192 RepID=A0A4E0RLM9_FASHE|nr:hypothetical protein D915_000276 [Fasciola hepatica]